jgi:hypothetical protein
VFINLVYRMNSFRFVHIENYQRRKKNRSRLQRDPRGAKSATGLKRGPLGGNIYIVRKGKYRMNSNRKIAIITGVVFIIATITALLAASVEPVLTGPDYLTKISVNVNQVARGAFFYLIAAFTSVGIAILMYPIMKRLNTSVALGSVVFRTIEAVMYMVAVVNLLSVLSLGQNFTTAATTDRAALQAVSDSLLNVRNHATLAGVFAFCLGAFMYYYLFFQSRLIPRWLSGWGIVAIILMMAACLLSLFNNSPVTGYTLLIIPIAVQEMVLAIWLIIKGFNPTANGYKVSQQTSAA